MEAIKRFGLIGQSSTTSVILAALEAAFTHDQLTFDYHALDTPSDDLGADIERLLNEGCQGFIVNEPYEQAVLALPQVADVTSAARAIGGASLLVRQPDGTLVADNKQWQAILHDWEMFRISAEDAVCLILGNGAVAQAAAYALHQENAGAVTFVTSIETEESIGYEDLARFAPGATLIIHTPNPEISWPSGVPFPPKAVLYEMVVNPPVTRLMKLAQSAGAKTIGGLGALIWQSGYAFQALTGSTPPLDLMFAAAKSVLNRSSL